MVWYYLKIVIFFFLICFIFSQKNQGIWAESESDDDDGDKKQRKKRTDYTSSVSFVKSDKKLQDEVKDRKPSSSKTNESSRQTHSKKKSTRFSGLGKWLSFNKNQY